MSDEWVRLEVGNDWGVVYYTYPGERLTKHGTASHDLGLDLAPHVGSVIDVRWPDGAIRPGQLAHKSYESSVSDHGKSYPVRVDIYGLEWTARGVQCWVDIDKVEIRRIFKVRGKR